MNFSIFLLRLGIDPNNFRNIPNEPIEIINGYIYEVQQRTDIRVCPYCGSKHAHIIGYYYTETRCHQNDYLSEILKIKRVRFKCLECHKTYSPDIEGIERKSRISDQVKSFIRNDFSRDITFENIGCKYGVSTSYVLKQFDQTFPFVPRRPLPRVLCIDEIKFNTGNGKYCCVLYDFEKKEIVDIIENRKLAYLRRYFKNMKKNELNSVQIFISDMYDGYASVKGEFFPNATHIVDNFHVVIQLTRAVNQIRLETMRGYTYKNDRQYSFMKSQWKMFICREEKIPNKCFVSPRTGEEYYYEQMVHQCIKLSNDFWEAWLCLQDVFHHNYYSSFQESIRFVDFLSKRLTNSSNPRLQQVSDTYKKWRVEIANAFTREAKAIKYTNAIAECINNKLKTIIKSAYGYKNFERFRKRALLICTYSVFKN